MTTKIELTELQKRIIEKGRTKDKVIISRTQSEMMITTKTCTPEECPNIVVLQERYSRLGQLAGPDRLIISLLNLAISSRKIYIPITLTLAQEILKNDANWTTKKSRGFSNNAQPMWGAIGKSVEFKGVYLPPKGSREAAVIELVDEDMIELLNLSNEEKDNQYKQFLQFTTKLAKSTDTKSTDRDLPLAVHSTISHSNHTLEESQVRDLVCLSTLFRDKVGRVATESELSPLLEHRVANPDYNPVEQPQELTQYDWYLKMTSTVELDQERGL